MENWLFRLAMPYHVVIKGRTILIQNCKYNNLFEGRHRFRLTLQKYNYIKDNIAYNPDERFTIKGGEFWMYDSHVKGEIERDVNSPALEQYYRRLTLLIDLCRNAYRTDNNSLADDGHLCNDFTAIKEQKNKINSLLSILEKTSK